MPTTKETREQLDRASKKIAKFVDEWGVNIAIIAGVGFFCFVVIMSNINEANQREQAEIQESIAYSAVRKGVANGICTSDYCLRNGIESANCFYNKKCAVGQYEAVIDDEVEYRCKTPDFGGTVYIPEIGKKHIDCEGYLSAVVQREGRKLTSTATKNVAQCMGTNACEYSTTNTKFVDGILTDTTDTRVFSLKKGN